MTRVRRLGPTLHATADARLYDRKRTRGPASDLPRWADLTRRHVALYAVDSL